MDALEIMELKGQIDDLTEELAKANAEVNDLLASNQAMSETLGDVLNYLKYGATNPRMHGYLLDRVANHLIYEAEEDGAQ